MGLYEEFMDVLEDCREKFVGTRKPTREEVSPMYYAGNEREKKLDDQIRENVKASGDKALLSLFIQGQETLSQVRRIRDGLKTRDFEDFKPGGYSIGSGYIGFLPHGVRMKFPTEEEYREYIIEMSESVWAD